MHVAFPLSRFLPEVNYVPSLVSKTYHGCCSSIQALGECVKNFFSGIVHFKRAVFLSYQIPSHQWSVTNRIKLIYALHRSDDPKRAVELTNTLIAKETAEFRDEAEVLKQINHIPVQDREEIVSFIVLIRKELPYFTVHDQQKTILLLQEIPKDRRGYVVLQIIQLLQKERSSQAEKPAIYELLFSEWTSERRGQLLDLLPLLCAISSAKVAASVLKKNFDSPYPRLTLSLTRLLPSTNIAEEKYAECCSLLKGYCFYNLSPVALEHWKAPLSLAPSLSDLEEFLKDFMRRFPSDEYNKFISTFVKLAEIHREAKEPMEWSFSNVAPLFELLPKGSFEEACIQLISLMKFLKDPNRSRQLAITLKREWQVNEKEEINSLGKLFCSKFQDKILNDISRSNIRLLEGPPKFRETVVEGIFRDKHLNKLPELIIHLLEVPREHREAVMELISSLSDSKDSLEMLKMILDASQDLDYGTIVVLGRGIIWPLTSSSLSDFQSSVDFVRKQGHGPRVSAILPYFEMVKIARPSFSRFNILRTLLEVSSDENEISDLFKAALPIFALWADDQDLSFFFTSLMIELQNLPAEKRASRKEEICKFLASSKEFLAKSLLAPYLSVYLLSNAPPLSAEVIKEFQQAQSLCKFWDPKELTCDSSAFDQLLQALLKMPPKMRLSRVNQTLFSFHRTLVLHKEFPSYISGEPLFTPEATINVLNRVSKPSYPKFIWEIDTVMMNREPQKILSQLGKLIWIYGALPKLNYKGSPARNYGGVTRDLMARLFNAIRLADRAHLPFKEIGQENDTLILPQLKDPAFLNKDELGLLVAIGKVFGSALCNRALIVTGAHFHPLLFKLLHALSSANCLMMSSFDELVYNPVDDLCLDQSNFIPKNIYNFLLKVYLLEEYPYMFGEDLEERKANIGLFVEKDTVLQSMKDGGIESKEEFLNIYKIPHTLLAVSCIAKTCYDVAPEMWSKLKEFSYLVLAHRIQGGLFKEEILNSCEWEGALEFLEENELYLISWLIDITEEEVALFIQTISGGSALPEGQKLKIRLYSPDDADTLPTFSTCVFTMNLPARYPNYKTFRNKLTLAISSAKDPGGGFGFV